MWRIIPLSQHSAYENMAIDEAVGTSISKGASNPTIRFYSWAPSAVSIGCFQSMRDEVNLDECKRLGVDYVRRRTGGGAVYHDSHGEITYSVIAPENMLPRGIHESYAEICGWAIGGLETLGINAAFAPINDIAVGAKKISGSAQTRRGGVLLQHGTILYDLDLEKMFSVLNVSKEKISDKAIKSAKERVTCVRSVADVTKEELYGALLEGFTRGKEFRFDNITNEEMNSVRNLVRDYKSDMWNLSR